MENGIKYYSMLEPSGYGLSAIAYIESLLAMGARVHWAPLVQGRNGYVPWAWLIEPQQQVRLLIEECVGTQSRVDALVECLKPTKSYQCIVMHTVPEYWPQLIEPEGYHIGYSVWETSRLPQHFHALINQLDKVLVPTEFNRSVFEQSGISIPIDVVPHILGDTIRLPAERADKTQSGQINNFVFYTINEWGARKAMWTLLHCYLKAFSHDDPVELCIKTSLTGPAHEQDSDVHDTEMLIQQIKDQYPRPAKIRLIRGNVEQQEITSLHHNSDCYISTTHSEGWGLGAFEAAGYGNPVIMTGWGGQLDYLPDDLAYLINYHLVSVEDKRGANSYSADQCWAMVDEAHVVELMREVYLHRECAQERAHRLAQKLGKEYSSELIGKTLHKAIFE